MNTKKVIIDGKGCRYRTWDKDCALTGDHHGDNMNPCKFIDEKNCYYKQLQRSESRVKELEEQLKRKEQECEELNNEIIDMNSIIEDAAINLGNKDFTLYDLPFEIKKLRQECEALKSESFTMDSLISMQEEEIDRFRNALEEIEGLISDDEFEKCPIDGENCNYFTSRKILDIINKAKGAEDER